MKQLWAPWRMAYIDEGAKEPGCIFCAKYRQERLASGFGPDPNCHSVVMLNKYPYNNGHLLLAPKRHENKLGRFAAGRVSPT